MTFIDFEYILTRRNSWSLGLMLGLVATLGLSRWQAHTEPVYAAVTTMQVEPAASPAAASAQELQNIRTLLVSPQLRSQVIASLTPAERRVVLRNAMRHRRRGEAPPSIASALGSIEPETVGGKSQIRVRVTHPDPEAAALIANRYVEQFQRLALQDPAFLGAPAALAADAPFHQVDIALPDYSPRNGEWLRLKRSSLGIALFALGLTAAAVLSLVTALRNAGEMRSV